MKICHKCFQPEHTHRCFPISHPTISINLDTNTPYSIILLILQNAGVKIKQSSYSVMTQITGFIEEESDIEEVSEEEEEPEKKTQKKAV